MRAVDIIIKKRDSQELSEAEIQYFIAGYTDGSIPDYQASAWAMAVLLNGMSPAETTALTLAMANSGDTNDLSTILDVVVDKHSTGGVGDKTTLVVEPIVATCGLPVGKMSGRGLGFTGGTLDKMESIPGYRTDLTQEEFLTQLKTVGLVLTGQTGDLAPADGILYALRDVTGTVPSLPLIASSIMSKKIAAGAQRIVLDVKTGSGAFMQNLDDARELAQTMVDIGRIANRQTIAVLSDMNQPLGYAVGNSLEVIEAIDTLQGGGPQDFREHCYEIAYHMLRLGEIVQSREEADKLIQEKINSGEALEKFKELVTAQGGDPAYVDDPALFEKAPIIEAVLAERDCTIQAINAREVGETAVVLGAGRAKKGDPVDHAVGFEIHSKVGDKLAAGDPLFTIHARTQASFKEAKQRVLAAYSFSDVPVDPLPLFYGVVE